MATYKVLVYMGQPWRNIVTLTDFDSNNGMAFDSTKYASARYTESRLSEFAWDCFFSEWNLTNPVSDMTVDWIPTYDNQHLEPLYLPAKYPLFLINWHSAMGVGRYTCTPGFNPTDAFQAVINLIEDENAKFEMYPECPNGTTLVNRKDLKGFLDKDNVKIRMRSTYYIEEYKGDTYIIIENTPFEVSPATVKEAIRKLYLNGKLPEITDVGHESLDYGRRFEIAIKVKKGYDPHAVMTKLYKSTDLEKTYSTRYAFVNDLEPVTHTPRIAILEWIRYRRATIRRMKKIRLLEVMKRIHFLSVLIKIMESGEIDEFIRIVRSSKGKEVIEKLMRKFDLTDYQAERISDVKIGALNKDKYQEYCKELKELEAESEELMRMIKDSKEIDKIIIQQMQEGIQKYGFPRRTKVMQQVDSIKIAETDHYLIFTEKYVKKLLYDANGYKIGRIDGGEKVRKVFVCNNRDSILIFDKDGRVLPIEVNQIPDCTHQSVGIALSQIGCTHDFAAILPLDEFCKDYIVTVTRDGVVAKTAYSEVAELKKNKASKLRKLDKGDEIIDVTVAKDTDRLLIYTKNGKAVLFPFDDFETTALRTKGVQGIKLEKGDEVVGVIAVSDEHTHLVTVTDRGYMKRFKIKPMPETKRNEAGIEINSGNGNLIKAVPTNKSAEVMYGYTNEGVYMFDPAQIKAKDRIGKNQRVIELSSNKVYLFDVI